LALARFFLLPMGHGPTADRCCEGQEIRVAGIRSHWPPFWSWDGSNYPEGFNGAALRIIEEHTGYRARFVEIQSDPAGYVHAYTAMLRNRTVDVAMGIRGPADPRDLSYTVSTLHLETKCAIHKAERADLTSLRFLRPFDTTLWVALSAAICLVGFSMVVLRTISGRGVTLRFSAKSMYHSWIGLLGGDDLECRTGSARLLRTALLFLVLISTASYTANLAAFFLMPEFAYLGPKNMADLRKSRVCFASRQWGWAAEPFAREVIYPPHEFALGKTNEELQEYCKDQLVSRNVDAICDVTGQLDTFLEHHCDDLWLVPDIHFAPTGVVWLTYDAELMQNLSYAILEAQMSPIWSQMTATELRLERTCKIRLADTTPITLVQQQGVFIVFGLLLISAILLAIAERVCSAAESSDLTIQSQPSPTTDRFKDDLLKRITTAHGELHQAIHELTQADIVRC
jgi:hypothetical protein